MTDWWARRMRATADGVPINTLDGLAGKKKLRGPGRRPNPTPCIAPHSKEHLSLQHTHSLTLRPLPSTFDSSAAPVLQHIRPAVLHYCCKPLLLKVRLSIRGALNPYVLPPPAAPRSHPVAPTSTAWLPQDSCIRLPGPRRPKPSALPVLASVLANGVLLSETQYRLCHLILAVWRTSGGGVYTASRYTFP
jgi:hypothetical protein